MITGYNNDIKHRGTIFHVQTEDKGITSAWIESLIYTGGRILARKRVTYKQLLDEGADKPAIAKLMERQHRLMIHQIREGRFDAETEGGAVEEEAAPPTEEEIHTTRMQQQAEAMFAPSGSTPPSEELEREADAARAEVEEEEAAESSAAADAESPPPAEPAADDGPERVEEASAEEPAMEPSSEPAADEPVEEAAPSTEPAPAESVEEPPAAVEVSKEEEPSVDEPPVDEAPVEETPDEDTTAEETPAEDTPAEETPDADAPEGVAADAEGDDEVDLQVGPAPTLDQVIFDYLSSVAQEESLVLLMDESPALAAGTTTRMDLGTHASRSGKPIANAAIAVRMISKTGGPVTLAEGTTDGEGTLQLVVDVPEVERDTAALIITAASSIGNAEIKHLL